MPESHTRHTDNSIGSHRNGNNATAIKCLVDSPECCQNSVECQLVAVAEPPHRRAASASDWQSGLTLSQQPAHTVNQAVKKHADES